MRWLTAAGLCLGGGFTCLAAAETGRLLSRLFLPEDYRGEVQVTDVVQTSDGLIYASNLGAVKEYDGRAWRTIPMAASWIMDLDAGPDGRVYIAGVDELGFLEPGPDGRRVFRSILEHVPAELKPLGQQWVVSAHGGAAYWNTNNTILRWRDGVVKTWSFPAGDARRALYQGGRHLYFVTTDEGLFRLEDEAWVPVSSDARFKRLPTALLDDWAGPGLSFPDREGNIWRVDAGGEVQAWPSQLPAAIAAIDGARLSDAVRLRDGRLAIVTKNAGVLVLNTSGGIDLRFGTEGGLNVLNLFSASQDLEGGLWVGTAYGTVRIELDPSLTVFDQKNGAPPGNMYAMVRYAGDLYACGQDGLYRFTPGEAGAQGRFTSVPAATGITPYNLLAHPTGLVVVGDVGVQRYADGVLTLDFRSPHSINAVTASVTDPNRIFVGGVEFVHSLRWDGTAWRDEGAIEAVREDARSLLEDARGDLWVGTPSRGVARVRRLPGQDDWQSAQVDIFDTARGLPTGHDWLSVYRSPVGPLFTHARGVSAYDAATDRLVPAPALEAAGVGGRYTYPLAAGKGSAMWMQFGYPAAGDTPVIGGLLPTAGGGWEWRELSAGVYSALGFLGAGEMIWEADAQDREGVLWILGQQGIVRWDLNGALRDRAAAPPAVVLRGALRGPRELTVRPGDVPRLEFAPDPLRVRFASPVYAPKGTVEYQYRLLGYDERWSGWSVDNEAMFTNLTGGDFTFEVRARRGSGGGGPITAWSFSVLPPFWRSAPAVLGYVVGTLGLGWLVLRWRLASLVRDRARLEREVRQRTEELALERDRAQAANRAKTMFLASMSHELRTPLHAILGYSQMLAADASLPGAARDRLRVVRASGQHLLRLINEVLDLSKIEAGKQELKLEPFDLSAVLQEVCEAQEARTTLKNLVFKQPSTRVPRHVVGDAAKLRQVLENLLGNATKFTAHGEVELAVEPAGSEGRLRFSVRDTGPGIAADDMDRLFQPFAQAREGARVRDAGTGLGLAIAHRLVTMMGGRLEVKSEPGQGSLFFFAVPLPEVAMPLSAGVEGRRITGYEGPRRSVLAVDDIEANRALFVDLLLPLGFSVATAATAEEALEKLESQHPDLLLLDLRLPGMDGFELARRLRRDPRFEGMRILAASASVLGHDPGEAITAGCDGFIPKPFLEEDFLKRVGELLGLTWREQVEEPSADGSLPDAAVLGELRAAARAGDVVAMREAMQRLREGNTGLARVAELDAALRNFDTDRLTRLIESMCQEPSR